VLQEGERQQRICDAQQYYQHGSTEPVRVMPVDSRRMGISPPTAPATAAQGMSFPQAVKQSLAPFVSIAPVGGFDVSDGRIRLGECRGNPF
jgi:hypothetical protein